MPKTTAAPWVPDDGGLPALQRASKDCRGCDLWRHATQTVFGEGPAHPDVMLVGEQPGDKEDLAGHPFVGPAGRVLDEALAAVGIDRRRTYVTNAVKHFKFERGSGQASHPLQAEPAGDPGLPALAGGRALRAPAAGAGLSRLHRRAGAARADVPGDAAPGRVDPVAARAARAGHRASFLHPPGAGRGGARGGDGGVHPRPRPRRPPPRFSFRETRSAAPGS